MMPFFQAPAHTSRPIHPPKPSIHPILLFVVAIALAFCSHTSAHAQTEDPDDVVRIRTDLVSVPTIVLDSRDRRVPDLTQSSFRVRDNGREVAISYFATGADRVALAFALDSSGSIRELIAQQRDAALKLFSRFGNGSRVAVFHFGDRPTLTAPFSTDGAKAQIAFTTTRRLDRHTAIFDAAAAVINGFRFGEASPAERRIMILMSDGLDTSSATRASAVIDEARSLGVSIYVIHLPLFAPRGGELSVRPPAKGFRDLAEKTGGKYFLAGDVKFALNPQLALDLTPIFQAIEEDLRGQYVLGYYQDETARASAVHRIDVTLNTKGSSKLRVKTLREDYNLKP